MDAEYVSSDNGEMAKEMTVSPPLRRRRRTPTTALILGAVVVLLVVAYAPLVFLSTHASPVGVLGGIPLDALAFGLTGTIIARRRPQHRVGWILITVALLLILMTDASLYTVLDYRGHGGLLPFGPVAGLLNLLWAPGILMIPAAVLLFPDCQLPSLAWRWALRAYVGVGAACVIGFYVIAFGDFVGQHISIIASTGDLADFDNPTGMLGVLYAVWAVVVVVGGVGAFLGLIINYRHASQERRQLMKWFMLGAVLLISAGLPVVLVPSDASLPTQIVNVYFDVALAALPISIGIGVLRYRLYDVEVVINRALVYGALAVLITIAYVSIAVGLGSLVGGGNNAHVGLALLATAVVAVGFQPVRTRLQTIANRLVYGRSTAPYEALSQFSEHTAIPFAIDEIMPHMARLLAESTRAQRTDVWLRHGDALHPAASWPADAATPEPLSLSHDFDHPNAYNERAAAIRHQHELLGALAVTKRAGEVLKPVEENLLSHLANQAGLLLKNVELTADLQGRLQDLRASRQRLVIAQDTERQRLESNLHDGAQQHLIALKIKLGLAQALTEKDPVRAKRVLGQLQSDVDDALESLRDLARGIYPAVLADQGLDAALRAAARRANLPIDVETAGLSRYPQELEGAVYFCVLEALQNIQKHAHASRVMMRLRDEGAILHLEVADNGRGFDTGNTARGTGLMNMADRLEALGANLDVRSYPGQGCTISAAVHL